MSGSDKEATAKIESESCVEAPETNGTGSTLSEVVDG